MDSSTMDVQHITWTQHILVIILRWSLVAAGTIYFIFRANKSPRLRHLPQIRGLAVLKSTDRPKGPRGVSQGYEVDHNKATINSLVAVPFVEPSSTESSSPQISLPTELVERIADYLFELKPPTVDSAGNAPVTCLKPTWQDVEGWMQASVDLHNMGFLRWLRVITVRKPEDWIVISQHLHLVREIICFDGTLRNLDSQRILAQFPYLYSATIDAHSDVWRDDHNRFTYKDIIVVLPPSLKRLEITHAHGPDIKVIDKIKRHCPQLEELRLGRCTMFNRAPACAFWASFPHDHDAYISDAGIEAYAHSLGHALAPLTNLRTLRMGLYLVPSDIVLAHRLYHRRGRTAPEIIDWRTAIPLSELPVDPFAEDMSHIDPATTNQLVSVLHQLDSEPGEEFDCPLCIEITNETNKVAETNANEILLALIPSLTNVQWMGWLTPGHLGVHSFNFSPNGRPK